MCAELSIFCREKRVFTRGKQKCRTATAAAAARSERSEFITGLKSRQFFKLMTL
jgi:hypothetical protein